VQWKFAKLTKTKGTNPEKHSEQFEKIESNYLNASQSI